MIYILLSVLCSVTVAVLLKFAKRYQISIIQAVTYNYLTAFILCLLFFKPDLHAFSGSAPWPNYFSLAILLPSIFLVQAASVRNLGIVKTDVAQRLSLFIPILAAYFIFGEAFNALKFAGIGIGFLAILLTFLRKSNHPQTKNNWFYAIMVFIGFGLIDVLFKQTALFKLLPYTTSLFAVFALSFIVSLVITLFMFITGKIKLQLVNVACGLILGLFNFGNILFYLKAHQAFSAQPATVFAAMNLGVIVTGSLIGLVVFKEKLTKLNYIGLSLAVAAVVLITIAQLYVI